MEQKAIFDYLKGMVIFYDHSNLPNSLKEIGRTEELPFQVALTIYAETPNPASQLIEWTTEEEKIEALNKIEESIKNPEWLNELNQCI